MVDLIVPIGRIDRAGNLRCCGSRQRSLVARKTGSKLWLHLLLDRHELTLSETSLGHYGLCQRIHAGARTGLRRLLHLPLTSLEYIMAEQIPGDL